MATRFCHHVCPRNCYNTCGLLSTATAAQADLYVQIQPGSDGALAAGLARYLWEKGLVDTHYLANHVRGWEEWQDYLAGLDPEEISATTGVPRDLMARLAEEYATSSPAVILLGLGLQRHINGGQNVRAISALAAMTGNLGREGGGIYYASTGHSELFTSTWSEWIQPEGKVRELPAYDLAGALQRVQDPPVKIMVTASANPVVQNAASEELQRTLAAMVEMSRSRMAQETERHYRNEFIQDILYNNLPNRDAVVNRGRLWGWDLTRPHLLVVMELDGRNNQGCRKTVWEQWHQLLRFHLGRQAPEAILADRSDQLIILIPLRLTETGINKSIIINLVKSLQKITTSHLAGTTFSAGVGRFYENVADLYRAYQEAKVALEVSRLLRRRAALTFFDELGVLRLIFNQGEQELEDYYEETLGPVVKYDTEHNTNLVETLAVFLFASGDHNRAAENMFIHVNTLRYRLKKIEEILSQDLRQLEVLVNLYTALQVKVMLGR